MNYENIINKTKEIESRLVSLGAIGKGLHEKISSIEYMFNENTVNAIRYIATIRNKLLHEDGFVLTSEIKEKFEFTYDFVIKNIGTNQHTNYNEHSSDYSNNNSNFNDSELRNFIDLWKNTTTKEKVVIGTIAAGITAICAWFNSSL
ncbi:hypothetical protein PJV97_10110 [Aliarcobacter butzleri]|uniref:hypothetical protein n=1 Tax=Aliarcobacter butzleri TaxID=28197 RepID=UPI00263F50C2|nr:hypothetical protein [Aliarcobacter butzleri]MDN5112694.1 hypothetical protein [Aliarcobacter butzleri]